MSEERLQEIKDSVEFQKEILEAHNMNTLCVDEEQELLEEIERLQEELKYTTPIVEHNQTIQSNINSYNKLAEYSKELEDNLEEQFKLTNRFANKSKELQQIIDKAIEYIEKCGGMELVNDYSFPEKPIIDKEAKTNLLNILKGSDK